MENEDNPQATLSPQDQLSDMIWSFTKAQLIYVAAKLEIADILKDSPKDAQTLARSIRIDPQMVTFMTRM